MGQMDSGFMIHHLCQLRVWKLNVLLLWKFSIFFVLSLLYSFYWLAFPFWIPFSSCLLFLSFFVLFHHFLHLISSFLPIPCFCLIFLAILNVSTLMFLLFSFYLIFLVFLPLSSYFYSCCIPLQYFSLSNPFTCFHVFTHAVNHIKYFATLGKGNNFEVLTVH